MRHLIINADGYGFTAGISRAIEECIDFGTVRSLSANVNFKYADGLAALVHRYPDLSVGCHVNPIVGRPILSPKTVSSLIDENGEFFYETFARRFLRGHIRLTELRAEMMAQVEKTRDLAGEAFSHIDFHMGLHKLPGLYRLFLDVAEKSTTGRIRTHRYLAGIEHRFPWLKHTIYLLEKPTRAPKYLWNLWLRKKAHDRGLAMPDRWVEIAHLGHRPNTIVLANYLSMLRNLPDGFSEFVTHPGYVDNDLKRWSSYLTPREIELRILLSSEFRDALFSSGIQLAGYRDIPLRKPFSERSYYPLMQTSVDKG
jgi:predicted glycoside hydrolase/deacetylase ChbG (UPF0249 family)